MAQIETLVEDIKKVFNGKDLSDRIHQLTSRLENSFVGRFLEYSTEREPTLRMSNIGKPLRQLYYELKGYPKEGLSPEAKLKFLYGSVCEELLIFLAIEAGHKVEALQEKVELEGISGSIDCEIDDVLIDVKSCSSFSYEKFISGDIFVNDPFGYVAQLTGYATARGSKRAGWLCIDKVLGKIAFVECPLTFDIYDKINEVKAALQLDNPPERCYEPVPEGKSGNLKLSIGCSYCAFKRECWKDSNDGKGLRTFLYSSGPMYLTNVAKEPKVFEVKDASNLD